MEEEEEEGREREKEGEWCGYVREGRKARGFFLNGGSQKKSEDGIGGGKNG